MDQPENSRAEIQASANAGSKDFIHAYETGFFNKVVDVMIENLKFKFQKGLSIVEGMTAAAILGASITVFMTLQSTQEQDFSH